MKLTYDLGIGRFPCFTTIRLNLRRVFFRRFRAEGEYFPAFRIPYVQVIT